MRSTHKNILQLRKEIDRIDRTLFTLITTRVKKALLIRSIKKNLHIPLKDISREKELITRATAHTHLPRTLVRKIYRVLFEIGRSGK